MKQRLTVIAFSLLAACQQPSGSAAGSTSNTDSLSRPVPEAPGTAVQATDPADTVTIGGRLFVWTDIDQAEFAMVRGMEPDTSEAVNLEKAPGRVRRSGDSLVFALENGGQKVMVNNRSDGEDLAEYTFQGVMPELKSWLVLNMGYEWFSYVLVDMRSGAMLHTLGVPQLSPDKKRFIASNADLVAQFNDNGFELFEMRESGPVLIQHYAAESWGPRVIKWKDADTFYAEVVRVNDQMEETVRYVKFSLPVKGSVH